MAKKREKQLFGIKIDLKLRFNIEKCPDFQKKRLLHQKFD
jgi:hypothetical protein